MIFIQDIYGDFVNLDEIVAIEKRIFMTNEKETHVLHAHTAERYGSNCFVLCESDLKKAEEVAGTIRDKMLNEGIPLVYIEDHMFRADRIKSVSFNVDVVRVNCGKEAEISCENIAAVRDAIAQGLAANANCEVLKFGEWGR